MFIPWQIEKQENGNYKLIPFDGNEDRIFYLDGTTLEPITYWFASDDEYKAIVAYIQTLTS